MDFNQNVLNIRDEKFMARENEPATLGQLCIDALLLSFPDEQALSGDDKLKRWLLAVKIKNGAEALTVEETSLVKKLTGKAYGPALVGPIYALIDPATVTNA